MSGGVCSRHNIGEQLQNRHNPKSLVFPSNIVPNLLAQVSRIFLVKHNIISHYIESMSTLFKNKISNKTRIKMTLLLRKYAQIGVLYHLQKQH